jgi:hypothetical protein
MAPGDLAIVNESAWAYEKLTKSVGGRMWKIGSLIQSGRMCVVLEVESLPLSGRRARVLLDNGATAWLWCMSIRPIHGQKS